jgi:hypothetical protein
VAEILDDFPHLQVSQCPFLSLQLVLLLHSPTLWVSAVFGMIGAQALGVMGCCCCCGAAISMTSKVGPTHFTSDISPPSVVASTNGSSQVNDEGNATPGWSSPGASVNKNLSTSMTSNQILSTPTMLNAQLTHPIMHLGVAQASDSVESPARKSQPPKHT